MVCMSSTVTSNLIDKITIDYDAAVIEWAKELKQAKEVTWHIKSDYAKEMATKSEVVHQGIFCMCVL